MAKTKKVPTTGPEENATPSDAKQSNKDKQQTAEPVTFSQDGRKFQLLVKSLHVPGRGKSSAAEVLADGTLQEFLVKRLDERGSGVIKEIF